MATTLSLHPLVVLMAPDWRDRAGRYYWCGTGRAISHVAWVLLRSGLDAMSRLHVDPVDRAEEQIEAVSGQREREAEERKQERQAAKAAKKDDKVSLAEEPTSED